MIEIFSWILSVIVLIIVITLISYPISKHTCKTQAGLLGLKWDYSFFSDCVVNVDDKYVPLSNYQVVKK
jgi:hypothetical protein